MKRYPKRPEWTFINIERIQKFLSHDIWCVNLDDYPPLQSHLIRYLRVLLLAFRGFVEDKVLIRASALTYYSLLSIVPILAMGFGIAKGFGMDKYLEDQLIENFQGQQEVMTYLIEFSSSMLQKTGGGLIAGIGMIVLFYSVLMVFSHIEHSFNDIWQIATPRSFTRKFADYLSMMLVAPVLMIASSGITVYISTQVTNLSDRMEFVNMVGPYIMFLLEYSPYVLLWILFSLIYIVMPNTKVNVKSGIIAGIIAGSLFSITQWIYIDFQVGVSRYNAIYGSFAALPLFLAWMQLSWLIVLLGAEISFSHQNQNLYEFEAETETISHKSKLEISVLLLNRIVSRFVKGEAPFTSQEISKDLKLPIRLVRSLLDNMVACNILSKTYTTEPKNPAYQPAQDIDTFTITYVMQKLNEHGASITLNNVKLKSINEIHQSFFDRIQQYPENILVKDLA